VFLFPKILRLRQRQNFLSADKEPNLFTTIYILFMRKVYIVTVLVLILFIDVVYSQPYIWGPAGPAPISDPQFAGVSGRVWGITIVPLHTLGSTLIPPSIFIAVDQGGIWKSPDFTTAQPTWFPIADKWDRLFYAEMIALDPNNPNRLLVPAGQQMVLVSEDNGNTWDTLGKKVFGGNGPQRKLFIDPTSGTSNTLYGLDGSYRGSSNIFKSTDGGNNWFPLSLPFGGTIWDLDYTLTSANKLILYAAVGQSGIWQSTDGGSTWTIMAIGLVDVLTGSPTGTGNIGMISFAADHTPTSPGGIFAFMYNSATAQIMNTYALKSNGWTAIGTFLKGAVNYESGHGLSASSTFQAIGLSESNMLYEAAGDPQWSHVYQTANQGASWISIENSTTGNFRPHTDVHCFAFYAGKVYMGTDGGIYRFNPVGLTTPGSSVWESLNSLTLQSILAQGVSVHPTNPQILLCGSQDNGISYGVNQSWTSGSGGDNGPVLFDPDPAGNGLYAYATNGEPQYASDAKTINVFQRSTDGGHSWNDDTPPDAFNQYAGSAPYAPFAIDPLDHTRIVLGIDRVYETHDRGDHWTNQISPIFSPAGTRTGTGQPFGNQAGAIAYGVNHSIWVAYGGSIFQSVNDGGDGTAGNWTLMNNGISFGGAINSIAVDQSSGQVYCTTTTAVWVFQYSPATQKFNWVNITSDLYTLTTGAIQKICLVPASLGTVKGIFVGMRNGGGIFASFDGGQSWVNFSFNLPKGWVTDIQYFAPQQLLFAALYGRGIYHTSLSNVLDPTKVPGITINIPTTRDDCGDIILPLQGSTINVSYTLNNPIDNDGYRAVWTVTGADVPAGEPLNGTNLSITNLSADLTLHVDIYFNDGLQISKTRQINPITTFTAGAIAFFCRNKNNGPIPIPWYRWDPELWQWDPLKNTFTLKRFSRAILVNAERQTLNDLKQIRGLISNLKN